MSEAKRTEYVQLLARNYVVKTWVVAEQCVGLPSNLAGLTRLDLGLDLPIQLRDFSVRDDGIRAGISFAGRVHDVYIPWDAVLGVVVVDHGAGEDPPAPPPQVKAAPRPYDRDRCTCPRNGMYDSGRTGWDPNCSEHNARTAPATSDTVVHVDFRRKRKAGA